MVNLPWEILVTSAQLMAKPRLKVLVCYVGMLSLSLVSGVLSRYLVTIHPQSRCVSYLHKIILATIISIPMSTNIVVVPIGCPLTSRRQRMQMIGQQRMFWHPSILSLVCPTFMQNSVITTLSTTRKRVAIATSLQSMTFVIPILRMLRNDSSLIMIAWVTFPCNWSRSSISPKTCPCRTSTVIPLLDYLVYSRRTRHSYDVRFLFVKLVKSLVHANARRVLPSRSPISKWSTAFVPKI